MKKLFAGALCAAVLAGVAVAAPSLIVTEVMSSAGGTGIGAVDWFELTNFGASTLTLTGYKMDDNSNAFGSSVALNGITSIAAGESVVFLETASPGTDIGSFRTFWGGINAVQIGSYTGSGVGLSSSADGVNIFDSGGSLVTGVSFGLATTGKSFYYNQGAFTGNSTVLTDISVAGTAGAFTSADVLANVGSPGAIPEPSTYAALFGASALGLALWRRRRSVVVSSKR